MKQGDKVKYTGVKHQILQAGETYEIYSVSETGIQVYIPTGFAGIKHGTFELIK